jgi:hypothetical protein
VAKNTQLSDLAANAEADALARLLDNGYCRVYDGTQPANGNTALSGNTLIAELRFSATSAPAAASGILTFNTMTGDSSADSGGTPTFCRNFKSDGTSAVMDGSAGLSGTTKNLEFATLPIIAGSAVNITSFTHTVAKATTGF